MQIGGKVLKGDLTRVRGSWIGGDDYVKGGEKREGARIEVLTDVKVEVGYATKRVKSRLSDSLHYEVIGDTVSDEILGLLISVSGRNVSFLRKGAKLSRAVYIVMEELPDLKPNLLMEELKKLLEVPFSSLEGDIVPLSGFYIGKGEKGTTVKPFSVYRPNQVIPAFLGEDDEDLVKITEEMEKLEGLLAQLEPDTEEYNKLKERYRELKEKYRKVKANLYKPDILRAVVQKTVNGEEVFFVSKKTEIRNVGENLTSEAKKVMELSPEWIAFGVVEFPTVNNLSDEMKTTSVEVVLSYGGKDWIEVADLNRIRNFVKDMETGLREILKADNPLQIKFNTENASVKKRLTDIAAFLAKHPEQKEKIEEGYKKLLKAKAILYSPLTVRELYTKSDLINKLYERGVNVSEFSSEDWQEFYFMLTEINERLEHIFGALPEVGRIVKFLYKPIETKVPIKVKVKTENEIRETLFPSEEPEIYDYSPTKVFFNLIRAIVKKTGMAIEDISFLFGGNEYILTEEERIKALGRYILQKIALEFIKNQKTIEDISVKKVIESVKSYWLGEFPQSVKPEPEMEIEIYDFPLEENGGDFDLTNTELEF
jgi:hypothetical protein